MNVKQSGEFQRHYFYFAMQQEFLFQLVVTLSLACLQATSEPHTPAPTKDVLFHHMKTLSGLRQKLSWPGGHVDDSVLRVTAS